MPMLERYPREVDARVPGWEPTITVEPVPGAEHPSQLRAFGLLLRARWKTVAAFALGGVVGMALLTLAMERHYTATAVVHIENEAPRVTKIDQVVAGPSYLESVEYFQDQVSLLKSRVLIANVIRELRLEGDEHFWARPPGVFARLTGRVIGLLASLGSEAPAPVTTKEAAPETKGVSPAAIDRYAANLEVKPIPNSRLIQVRVTARDPALAESIANAHANQYIARTLQAKFELTGAARTYLERELERVRTDVESSEAALNQFRRDNNVVASDEAQGNSVMERLDDLSRRLTAAQAQRIELEAQHALIANRDYEALPAVLQNALIQSLKGDLAKLETREAELSRIFLDGNPELQQVRAQIRQQRSRMQQEIERAVAGIESQYLAAKNTEDALRDELGRQQEAVLNLREISGQYVKLDQAVQANRHLYAALLERMGETDVVRGVQLSNISVLDPAERPRDPSSPRTMLNLIFGLALGLVFGVTTAAVLENVDTSLKTPDDVQRCLALPTLGVIPDFRRVADSAHLLADRSRAGDGDGVASRMPPRRSIAAEVFRTLRTSVLFFDPKTPPKTLLLTSSQAGEGKTATIVNLAFSLAQLGARVLLIDADLRKPRCHHALGIARGPGLTEILLDEADLDTVVRHIPLPQGESSDGRTPPRGAADRARPPAPERLEAELAFVQSGRLVDHTTELLASPRMRALLSRGAEAYDLVLVDSPPVFPVADASLLATMVDGVVMVVRGERTPRHVTQEALHRLRFMQAKVLGVVLNGINPGGADYTYRYSYYFQDAAGA